MVVGPQSYSESAELKSVVSKEMREAQIRTYATKRYEFYNRPQCSGPIHQNPNVKKRAVRLSNERFLTG